MLFLCAFFLPGSATAYDPYQVACDGGASASSSVCKDRDRGKDLADPNTGLVPIIANIIAVVGGIIAVVYIMINGLTFMSSSGDSAKIAKAREGLIYAAVGLAVIIVSRSILALILRYL